MKTKIILCALAFIALSCGSTGSVGSTSNVDYKNNFQVNKFLREFNKTEFLTTIESKRSNVENYVKEIKSKNLENENIKQLYANVQVGFNDVLNKMSSDINDINNILDFSTLNATNRYQAELKQAEQKETIFINTALKLLNPEEETSFFGDLFNTVLSFIPGAKQIQDIYLSSLKTDIQNKINSTKWSDWSSI